jgi:hypothetical protein
VTSAINIRNVLLSEICVCSFNNVYLQSLKIVQSLHFHIIAARDGWFMQCRRTVMVFCNWTVRMLFIVHITARLTSPISLCERPARGGDARTEICASQKSFVCRLNSIVQVVAFQLLIWCVCMKKATIAFELSQAFSAVFTCNWSGCGRTY